jgi:glycosyltransferase involved in cell wall biosynthesis
MNNICENPYNLCISTSTISHLRAPKLSFIVPIYNTAQYLPKCIDSLLNQDISFNEYQIILVNDGSTDHSLSICESYKKKHPNIILLSQNNAGQSAARNYGMTKAEGDYIWFVDSDDFIEPDCLGECLKICYQQDLDIFMFGADDIEENNGLPVQRQHFPESETTTVFMGKSFLDSTRFFHCIPFYIYRHQFLKEQKIHFFEGIYHEDNEALPRFFYPAKRVLGYNKVLYHVYLRPNSTIRSINPKKAFDLIQVARSLSEYLINDVASEDYPVFCDTISNAILCSQRDTFLIDKESVQQLKQAWYRNRDVLKWMKYSKNKKYRILGFIFQLFPKHIGCIYRNIMRIKHTF